MNRIVNTAAALLAAAWGAGAHSQAWPSKPIKVIIPFVAGGSSDIVGRAIGSKFRMTQIGFDVVAGTSDEFGKFMRAEVDRWTTVVNKGGIKPE